MLLGTLALQRVNLPSFILKNPIAPEERVMYKKKFFRGFMSRHIIFIGALAGFCLGFVKYELTKYYLFLKYKPLVNKYLDCCEIQYLNQLKQDNRLQSL